MSCNLLTLNVSFPYRVCTTDKLFAPENRDLASLLEGGPGVRCLTFIEEAASLAMPELGTAVAAWFSKTMKDVDFRQLITLPGGEQTKLSMSVWEKALTFIQKENIDRHSYILAIGGGAFLDVVGFAAATAHRGIRLIRIPTTTLGQADSGVGVKNGINFRGEKNYLGTFTVPWATINDKSLLIRQPEHLKRAGLSEIVKVAVISDASFFQWLEDHAEELSQLEPDTLAQAVEQSALLHARHIVESGDPFEQGSSRPLDFGHWSAHELEALSEYSISHATAVAIGMHLDIAYSVAKGWMPAASGQRVVDLLAKLGLPVSSPTLGLRRGPNYAVLSGLEHFRQHLGGNLTLLMLKDIGQGFDIHEISMDLMTNCISGILEGKRLA